MKFKTNLYFLNEQTDEVLKFKTYNKKIGGATYSQHIYGTAADIVVQGVKPEEVAKYAEYLMPKTGGIGLYPTFTHVDVRVARARWKNYGKEGIK